MSSSLLQAFLEFWNNSGGGVEYGGTGTGGRITGNVTGGSGTGTSYRVEIYPYDQSIDTVGNPGTQDYCAGSIPDGSFWDENGDLVYVDIMIRAPKLIQGDAPNFFDSMCATFDRLEYELDQWLVRYDFYGAVYDRPYNSNDYMKNWLYETYGEHFSDGHVHLDPMDGTPLYVVGGNSTGEVSGFAIRMNFGSQTDDSVQGSGMIFLGAGNDSAVGSSGADFLDGGSGNDTLTGGFGKDTLIGGSGTDTLRGGGGNDYLHAGSDYSADILFGDAGNDTIYGSLGDNLLYGGSYNDSLYGDAGNDTIYGGSENDSLWGGAGNDVLLGEGGSNTVFGESGNDLIYGGIGIDRLDGGEGRDTLSYFYATSGVTVRLYENTVSGDIAQGDTISGFEDVSGGFGSDALYGSGGDNILDGVGGDDLLIGLGGNDMLIGGGGNDTLIADWGTDILIGGAGNDLFAIWTTIQHAVINDFARGADHVQIQKTWFASYADLRAAAYQSGNDVMISKNGMDVMLKGVQLSTLSTSDFYFV
ncbi:calcium-binding protein [Microvirga lotononidis]|uniref:Putative calcium-binding protein n=1 Tax=Microvirga lotononidis TaxID=864069 RepID=I4YWY8_9HYPH|nr:calcium-binding protein [Microvirga lotononidis]EIM28480.1 putative calcium-binding protein [Microvirga lotononidis]WQO27446.1 calcium-binding protein [Microvirga lotononidis]